MPPGLCACFGRRSAQKDAEIAIAEMAADDDEDAESAAVVVELFSSQGCATSPEAEVFFSRLGRGDFKLEAPLILLAFHVDIWDYTGWKDPFGSSQWTVRQKAYVEALHLDTMFTPQIVVQGQSQCIATDQDAALSLIASAPRVSAPAFQATFERPGTESLKVTLTGILRTKVDSGDIMVALYESGLVTDCDNGENKGKKLANDYVVRRLEKLCSVKDTPAKKTVTGTLNFSLWEGFKRSKCGIAVFVQTESRQILGSQNFQLPDKL
jgi:hypothetical protein